MSEIADPGRLADLHRLVSGAVRAPEAEEPRGASETEIRELARRLGQDLPVTLRIWLSVCRGAAIGPGGVFGHRPDQPSLDMASMRELVPEWRQLSWLPVAGDGCGNYYVLTGDGAVNFVDTMNDPRRLDRPAAPDLLSFMTQLLSADQQRPSSA